MVGFGVPAQQFCPRAERDASTHPTKGRAIAYGSLLGGGNARAACSTSPRVRGEVDLRAEPWRKRSKSGEGACPQAQTRGYAPSPGFLRCARNPTSPRTRGEVAQVALPRTPTQMR